MAPPGEARLFLEADWAQRLAFERNILHYYVSPHQDEGMRHCLAALDGPFRVQIRKNLKLSARKLGGRGRAARVPYAGGLLLLVPLCDQVRPWERAARRLFH